MPYQQTVEDHHSLTYGNNVMLVTQQSGNKLRSAVSEVACTGEAHAAADLIGSLEYVEMQGRERSNLENPAQNTRRWLVFPNEIKSGQYIEREEVFQQLYNPTQPLVRAHTMAVDRGIQDKILGVKKKSDGTFVVDGGGILGKATSGKRPGGPATGLPSAYVTPHNNTGLTLDKLRAARLRLQKDDFGIDMGFDELYCAITPQQADDLIGIVAGTKDSLNAYQQSQLVEGMPTRLMGMTWIVTNRLPLSGTTRSCPIWSKRNIALGVWEDVNGAAWNDTHADNLPYARVRARVDCVRIEDAGVQVIECAEA